MLNSPRTISTRLAGALAVFGLLGLLIGGLTAAAQSQSVPADQLGGDQLSVAMINDIRAEHGLAPLIADAELAAAAAEWSQHLRSNDYLAHADDITIGITGDWYGVGENVGRGNSIVGLMESFRLSTGHLANLLNPTFTHVGVVTVYNADGVVFTTQRFAHRAEGPIANASR